jgi:hypothetical protein
MGSCGFSALAHRGRICPRAIPRIKPVIVGFSTGVARRVFENVLQRLAEDLRDRGKLDLTEGFIDVSFTAAKKGRHDRPNQTREGLQDHGNLRRPWSSSRRTPGQRFAG